MADVARKPHRSPLERGFMGPEENCQPIVHHRITLAGIMPAKGQPPCSVLPQSILSLISSLDSFLLLRSLLACFSAPERNSIPTSQIREISFIDQQCHIVCPVCARIALGRPSGASDFPLSLPLCSSSTRYSTGINGNRRSGRVFFQLIDTGMIGDGMLLENRFVRMALR